MNIQRPLSIALLAATLCTGVISSASAEQTPAEILAGDAPYVVGDAGARGCRDKERAKALIAAGKDEAKQDLYLKLYAEGLVDQSCRGFTNGLGVHIEVENEDGFDCILSIDNPESKECVWIETGLLVKR